MPSVSTIKSRKQLEAIQTAPSDERVNNSLYLGSNVSDAEVEAIYALTHVDLMPETNNVGVTVLTAMGAASSRDRRPLRHRAGPRRSGLRRRRRHPPENGSLAANVLWS